jgi:hypothetical protein
VNTSLLPPLNGSVLQTLQPDGNGRCGARIAGETVCDPRARCEPARSGGVECACEGNGLFVKRGVRPDGHACEQFRCDKGRHIADDGGHDGAEALSCAACAPGYAIRDDTHALTACDKCAAGRPSLGQRHRGVLRCTVVHCCTVVHRVHARNGHELACTVAYIAASHAPALLRIPPGKEYCGMRWDTK